MRSKQRPLPGYPGLHEYCIWPLQLCSHHLRCSKAAHLLGDARFRAASTSNVRVQFPSASRIGQMQALWVSSNCRAQHITQGCAHGVDPRRAWRCRGLAPIRRRRCPLPTPPLPPTGPDQAALVTDQTDEPWSCPAAAGNGSMR